MNVSGNISFANSKELSTFIKDSVKFYKCCTSLGFSVGTDYKPDAEVLGMFHVVFNFCYIVLVLVTILGILRFIF